MHRIAVIAMNDVLPFDLATPCEVFGRLTLPANEHPYRVRVCGEAARVRAGHIAIVTEWGLAETSRADTLIVPGIADVRAPASPEIIAAIRRAAARGARIASICTGAFVLAQAGVLDGLRATTHWLAAPALRARFPAIRVEVDELYIDNGQILTSAGAAAGIDLCLQLIRRDYGPAAALVASRLAVMPLERPGGQAQFISLPQRSAPQLDRLLRRLSARIGEPLTLSGVAREAGMTPRTLNRRFLSETGLSPMQWILRERVRSAQRLLEHSDAPLEEVARQSGFDSAEKLRERFKGILRVTPSAYRAAFHRGG